MKSNRLTSNAGLAVAVAFLMAPLAAVQAAKSHAPRVAQAVRHGRAQDLRTLRDLRLANIAAATQKAAKSGPINDIRVPGRYKDNARNNGNAGQPGNAAQGTALPAFDAPAVNHSIAGYSSDDNAAVIGGRITPPDSNGDVGQTAYVEYVNLGWDVFDKTSGTRIAGPFIGNLFWQGFGGVCETQNAGDPIVLYDHLAHRWLFSQFDGAAGADGGHQCIAISDGEDPTGPYTLYDFLVSPGAFNDYPKLTVWPDGYYMTTHEFTGNSFTGVNLTVFDRQAMLAGNANAGFIQFTSTTSGDQLEFGAEVGNLEGTDLPPAGTCNHVVHATDVETTGVAGADRIRVWEACVNFANPASSTLNQLASVSIAPFDQNLCNFNRSCINQNSKRRTKLDALAGFTMYRFNNRYFPTEGVLKGVVTTTVDVGGDRAGVWWAGLDVDPASGVTSIGDNGALVGVVDFNDGLNRWMGSASVDSAGNIGIGYTLAGSGKFPSVYFTVHERGVDGAGQVQAESACIDGTGSTEGANRWGDYASTSVDVVDQCTFWHTNEYVETTGSFQWNTRVCSFKVASCGGGGPVNNPPTASFTFSCTGLSCSFDASASSDSDGTIVSYAWDFGDGGAGSGLTASHTYAAGGTFSVGLTVTDNGGATGNSAQSVTASGPVNNPPSASFTSSCTDLACSFDGSASSDSDGTIVSYAWDFGDGSTASGVTASHTYAAGGTFNVTLTVTDDGGAANSTSQNVTVSAPGGNITLSAVVNNRGRVKLTWSGATGTKVDIFRNGVKIKTTNNDGSYTDRPSNGTWTYVVCEKNSSTQCSNPATVTK